MPLVNLPIGGGFYQSESLPISAQRCINLMPTILQTPNAENQTALFNTLGQSLFIGISGGGRGFHAMNGVGYAVVGNALYKITSDNLHLNIGNVAGVGPVSMADNGSKLVIVAPNLKSYVYDGSTTVEITNVSFRKSDTVSFKDGYFIFTASDGSVFFNSALNDPLTYNGLDFGTAEMDPDKIKSSIVIHNELFIIGEETIELFQNVGGSDFPFQRIQGANIQKGSHATFGVVALDETFAFIGGGANEKTGIYQVSNSISASKISTSAIDNEIQKFTKLETSNSLAMTYFDRGNQIAVFTFESTRIPSRSFAYNATASKMAGYPIWFEYQSGVVNNRWNINAIAVLFGKILAMTIGGDIVELDKETYTDLGSVIKKQFTTAPFTNQYKPVFVHNVLLWMEVGLNGNPVVLMDYSDDGRAFKNPRTRNIGSIGEYGHQVEWRRNGRTPSFRVHRFTMTDSAKTVIRRLQANVHGSGPDGG